MSEYYSVVCVLLSSFICWWTVRLFPYLGYFKTVLLWTWRGTDIFSSECFHFLCMYSEWICMLDHTVVLFLIFWGSTVLFSIVTLPVCDPINNTQVFSLIHIITNISYHLSFRCWPSCQTWDLVLICISLKIVMFSIFSCTCWPFHISSLQKCLSFAHF